jgi:hypothetical protein
MPLDSTIAVSRAFEPPNQDTPTRLDPQGNAPGCSPGAKLDPDSMGLDCTVRAVDASPRAGIAWPQTPTPIRVSNRGRRHIAGAHSQFDAKAHNKTRRSTRSSRRAGERCFAAARRRVRALFMASVSLWGKVESSYLSNSFWCRSLRHERFKRGVGGKRTAAIRCGCRKESSRRYS